MKNIMNGRIAYETGIQNLKIGNFIEARTNFKVASENPNYRANALSRLAEMDIKERKYKRARKLLESGAELNSPKLKEVFGRLESCEYNFKTSQKYYSECLLDEFFQNKVFCALGEIHLQLGNNRIARKMFETLLCNESTEKMGSKNIMFTDVIEGNYKESYNLLQELLEKETDISEIGRWTCFKNYLLRCMGKLSKTSDRMNPEECYQTYRLLNSTDESALLNHIEKHKNQEERYTNGCFLKYVDLKQLLYDVRSYMEECNPIYSSCASYYRIRLDNPIGFKEDEITSDIEVVTFLGTKDILTMYPASFSDEFDKEGMSTSKELMLKRKNGVNVQ